MRTMIGNRMRIPWLALALALLCAALALPSAALAQEVAAGCTYAPTACVFSLPMAGTSYGTLFVNTNQTQIQVQVSGLPSGDSITLSGSLDNFVTSGAVTTTTGISTISANGYYTISIAANPFSLIRFTTSGLTAGAAAIRTQAFSGAGASLSGTKIFGAFTPGHAAILCTFNGQTGLADTSVGCPVVPALPSAPQALAAGTPTSTTIPITYTAPATGNPASYTYTVSYATNSGGPYTVAGTTSALFYTVTGLPSATLCYIEIFASNSAGNGLIAGPISATTAGAAVVSMLDFSQSSNSRNLTIIQ